MIAGRRATRGAISPAHRAQGAWHEQRRGRRIARAAGAKEPGTMSLAASGASQSSGPSFPLADRYRIVARVGLGGTAIVYRCVDLHTERIVAVKVLRTNGPLIPEAAARFRREARLAAVLSHPYIVRVLDYGYTLPLTPQS